MRKQEKQKQKRPCRQNKRRQKQQRVWESSKRYAGINGLGPWTQAEITASAETGDYGWPNSNNNNNSTSVKSECKVKEWGGCSGDMAGRTATA